MKLIEIATLKPKIFLNADAFKSALRALYPGKTSEIDTQVVLYDAPESGPIVLYHRDDGASIFLAGREAGNAYGQRAGTVIDVVSVSKTGVTRQKGWWPDTEEGYESAHDALKSKAGIPSS